MASNSKILEIVIKAKDEATQELNKLSSTLKKNEAAFKSMSAVGAVAFAGIATFVGSSIKSFGEAERSQRQLEYAILGVSKGTKEQVAEVEKLAQALERKAGIDADGVRAGVAQLSTFGLQSKSVVDLTKSLADLTVNQFGVTASADNYISSANIMAKALRGEFGMLQKMGIRFTEHQQELINTGTEQEKVATIIEGLNQNLRETTDTVGGFDVMMGQLRHTMGSIQDAVGKSLQPLLLEITQRVLPIVENIAKWVEENPKLTATIIVTAGAVSLLVGAIGLLGLAIPAVIAGFGFIATVATGIGFLFVGALIPTIMLLITHWDLLKEGAVTAFTNIGENLLFFFNLAKLKFDGFMLSIRVFWNDVKGVFKSGIDSLTAFFDPLFVVIDKVLSSLDKVISKAKSIGGSIAKKVSGKAIGGGVQLDKTYLVGEKGPELFRPSSNGSIIPNNKLAGAGGMNLTINLNGGTYLDDNVAEKIGDQIIQNFKRISRI